jgi:hypothetical protein
MMLRLGTDVPGCSSSQATMPNAVVDSPPARPSGSWGSRGQQSVAFRVGHDGLLLCRSAYQIDQAKVRFTLRCENVSAAEKVRRKPEEAP